MLSRSRLTTCRQAQKFNLKNTYSNYSSILTYNETGYVDYTNVLHEYEQHSSKAVEQAGVLLKQNLQDQTARSGYALAGWRPRVDDMAAKAVEWWNWGMSACASACIPGAVPQLISPDWEDSFTPETSSFVFGTAGENLTFNQFGAANNFVLDPRGYSAIIQGEASTFLKENDPRLRLNTQVTDIQYSDDGVTVHNADGSCVSAAYAILTFSLGVLQQNAVSFTPELPRWKQTSIEKFNMGTYTKIFLQFDHTFWPTDTEYFLYASPTTRGFYPVFQSLSHPDFLPGSNIIFVTVVSDQSYRVENMSDEETKDEVLAVLREMFPDKHVPEPTAFMYPRWTKFPWSYGSYSNWPAGTTLEMHQNLRANAGRLWFAGEATSAEYFGFLHGAYFEGRITGEEVGALLNDECVVIQGTKTCGHRPHYEELHGTTRLEEYNFFNGWPVSSFYTSGEE